MIDILFYLLLFSPLLLFIGAVVAIEHDNAKHQKERGETGKALHNFYELHGEVMPACMFDYCTGGHFYSRGEIVAEMRRVGLILRRERKAIDDYADA